MFGTSVRFSFILLTTWMAASGTLAVLPTSASGASPKLEWTRQLSSSDQDTSFGVSADGLGSVYISGFTNGNIEGTNAGGSDAFLSKYDASGALAWTKQLGRSGDERGRAVSSDGAGNVYISGWTDGSLDGTTAGGRDAFIAKFNEVPEPTTLALAAIGLVGMACCRRRR